MRRLFRVVPIGNYDAQDASSEFSEIPEDKCDAQETSPEFSEIPECEPRATKEGSSFEEALCARSSAHSVEEIDAMGTKLRQAKAAGESTRRRITGTCLFLGSVLWIGSMVLGELSSSATVAGVASFVGIPVGSLIIICAVLPTDQRLVHRLLKFASLLGVLFFLLMLYRAVLALDPNAVDGCLAEWKVSARWYCRYWVGLYWLVLGMICGTVSCGGAMFIRKPPRAALTGMWKALGGVYISWGVVYTADVVIASAAGSHDVESGMLKSFSLVLWGWLAFSDRIQLRQKIQAALIARGGQVSSAAGIAALMGSHSPKEVRDRARQIFFGTTLEGLTFGNLAENSPNPALFQFASAMKFGDVDWFVSHSWRDPAQQKWDVLQAKRIEFIGQNHREPKIWFDKICIDQNNIKDTLMCLPVFLSGCKRLLVLCGPTCESSRTRRPPAKILFRTTFLVKCAT